MKVTVQVKGLDELKRDLARLSAGVQGRLGRNAAMAAARVIAKHARSYAPVATGALRRSIKARRPPNGQPANRRIALAGSNLFYSAFIEKGTRFIAPRSFLRRANDENGPEARAKMEDNLRKGIDKEALKQNVPEDLGER